MIPWGAGFIFQDQNQHLCQGKAILWVWKYRSESWTLTLHLHTCFLHAFWSVWVLVSMNLEFGSCGPQWRRARPLRHSSAGIKHGEKSSLCRLCWNACWAQCLYRKQTAKVNGTFEQVPVGILCSLEPLPCAAPSTWSTRERVTHSQ